jgi:phosphate transport system ATP-binding protein
LQAARVVIEAPVSSRNRHGVSRSTAPRLRDPIAMQTTFREVLPPTDVAPKIAVHELTVSYFGQRALGPVSLEIPERRVTALIGPSGCGKSTLLRALNRMHDLVDGARVQGQVWLEGVPIYGRGVDAVAVRKRIGMVFQKSNAFPKSIFENVAYGLRIAGLDSREELAGRVERALRRAALWHEVNDRLHESALGLSGGQAQRLCIARALAIDPDVILMDEPASALDPVSTAHLEELITDIARDHTVVIVTHNLQQAARISHRTAFLYLGQLIECNDTEAIFKRPSHSKTAAYVRGQFG